MGDMAEYYDERTEDAFEPEDYQPRREHRKARSSGPGNIDHYPADDDSCKALIRALSVFEWTTTKTYGSHSEHPYRLYADIAGTKHIIHLPRRRGTVLAWLKVERDTRRNTQ